MFFSHCQLINYFLKTYGSFLKRWFSYLSWRIWRCIYGI